MLGELGVKQTDGDGNTTFNLSRSGSYGIDASKAGYKKPADLNFDFDLQACLATRNVTGNVTKNITIVIEVSGVLPNTSDSTIKPADKMVVKDKTPTIEEQQRVLH